MKISAIVTGCALSVAIFTAVSCGSNTYMVSDDITMLSYCKDPSSENLDNLTKAYNAAINSNRKKGIKQPGLFADYAVALAKQGRAEEANGWFNNEVNAFPTSREYVRELKRQLIPQFLDDTSTSALSRQSANGDAGSMSELGPARRAAAEERAAAALEQDTATAEQPETNADKKKSKSHKSKNSTKK